MTNRRSPRTHAFTALEVMFALAIMAVALVAVLATMSSSGSLRKQEREVGVAMAELTSQMEQFRGMAPSGIIGFIQADAQDVPGVGRRRTITAGIGLEGTRQVLRDATLTITLLSESRARTEFGLPAEPDFDGTPGSSVYSQYRVAPVRFEITWRTGTDGGPSAAMQSRSLVTIFYPQSMSGT